MGEPSVQFTKYQGTGNDFIIINAFTNNVNLTENQIKELCDRKFGIGSDGIILIKQSDLYDFEMVFYNPDASMSFCGNGSRCAVAFAYKQGYIGKQCTFLAIDGPHSAEITDNKNVLLVKVKMKNTAFPEIINHDLLLETGSPHYLTFLNNLSHINPVELGQKIRYNSRFAAKGVNVNFIEIQSDSSIKVRTYERGVENETLSCGTGVTAAAIGSAVKNKLQSPVKVETLGGNLQVDFTFNEATNTFEEVFLTGPATEVFKGTFQLL